MSAPSNDTTRSAVLLVDDEANVTAALIRHFPKQDYEVFTVTSAEAAYELLGRRPIDVIVSDELMPGESGMQFLSKVRRLYPSVIRMVLSGQASMDAAIRAINEAEAYRFFLKPCNPTDLLVAVKQALDERRLRRQGLAALKELQDPVPSALEKTPPSFAAADSANDARTAQPSIADHIERPPQPSHRLRIGDRVQRRSAASEGPGTVTQVLAHGVVRVLWDFSVPSSIHTFDSLSLLTDVGCERTL